MPQKIFLMAQSYRKITPRKFIRPAGHLKNMSSRHTFIYDLRRYIDAAWDNEQEFLANFWEWPGHDEVELLEFYMADGTCKVVVMTSSGRTVTTTISTEEFLEWAEDIETVGHRV